MSRPAATTSNRNATGSNRNASSWVSRIMLGGVALLVLVIVVCFATVFFGMVHGEEFSPDDFTRRRFTYYELPLVGVQITPIRRRDTTGQLEKHLQSKQLIPAAAAGSKSWHLVRGRRGSQQSSEGDAIILCAYFDAENGEGKTHWLEWTTEHQELAGILWPEVAELARQQLYFFIPDVMEQAAEATRQSVPEFRAKLKSVLIGKYRRLAETQQELGDHDAAVELYRAALAKAPDDADLQAELARAERGPSSEAGGGASRADDRDGG